MTGNMWKDNPFWRRSTVERNRVTIRDVAKYAGVSHQTVSRVINGREQVTSDTRQTVENAIQFLGYRPNASARSLAAGKTNTIACISPNLVDYTFAAIIEGAELTARQHGYFLLAASAPSEVEFSALIEQLYESRRIDGLLVINPYIDHRTDFLPEKFPTIFIGDVSNRPEVGWVALDDENAGYQATHHLVELGHRNILCILGQEYEACTQDRKQGYMTALKQAGVSVRPEWILAGDWTATSAYQGILQALKEGVTFTAIFAQNDRMAIGAIRALRDVGIRVPDQVSVIGVDDMPLASYFDPSLTTISQDMNTIGQEAARLLIERITQPESQQSYRRFPVKLENRKSTAQIMREGGGNQ